MKIFFLSRYHDGIAALPNMSDLLALLHTNSPLSLIHRYLDVQSIESEEILEKLQKTMMGIDDDNDKLNRGKRMFNHLIFPKISLSAECRRDIS